MSDLSLNQLLYGFERPEVTDERPLGTVVYYWLVKFVDEDGEVIQGQSQTYDSLYDAKIPMRTQFELSLIRDPVGYDEIAYADVSEVNGMLSPVFEDGGGYTLHGDGKHVPFRYMSEYIKSIIFHMLMETLERKNS